MLSQKGKVNLASAFDRKRKKTNEKGRKKKNISSAEQEKKEKSKNHDERRTTNYERRTRTIRIIATLKLKTNKHDAETAERYEP